MDPTRLKVPTMHCCFLLSDLIQVATDLALHGFSGTKEINLEFENLMRLESCMENIFKDGIKVFQKDVSTYDLLPVSLLRLLTYKIIFIFCRVLPISGQ